MSFLLLAAAAVAACDRPFRMPAARAKLPGHQIESRFSEGLAVVRERNGLRLGYLDAAGTLVIPPRYFGAAEFSEGLAPVQLEAGARYGYVDRSGRTVIGPQFDAALPFSGGLAAVRTGASWGFVDRSGAYRVPPRFDNAWSFSEGRARVVVEGLTGFVDEAGAWVVPPRFFRAGDMKEGLAFACERSLCGYCDRDGKIAIPIGFDDAGSFSSGLAPVRRGAKWGYADRTGRLVIVPRFDEAAELAEGSARVGVVKEGSDDPKFGGYSGRATFWGFIDAKGEAFQEPKILGTTSFTEGIAVVRMPSGGLCSDCSHYRLMRRDGTFLPGRFDSASPFADGVAVVNVGDRGYVIDREGAPLVELDASHPRDPSEGVRRVGRLRFGFVDVDGETVIPHVHVTAQPFFEGLAFVEGHFERRSRKRGYVDRSGRVVVGIPEAIALALPFSDGLALVGRQVDGKLHWGYLDRSGTIAIPAKYADAAPFAEGLAAVKLSRDLAANDWGYVDRTGTFVIEPRFKAAGSFGGGLAYVEWVTEKNLLLGGVIDRRGAVVVDRPWAPELSRALFAGPSIEQFRARRRFAFGEGLVPRMTGGPRGWVDSSGRLVISGERFSHLGSFSRQRAPVSVPPGEAGEGTWGFVDPKGNLAVEPRFAEVQPFSEELARVRDSAGRYGYVAADGRIAIEPAWFEEAHPFVSGRALVRLGGLFGYIDRTGELAISPRYCRADSFSEGLAATGLVAEGAADRDRGHRQRSQEAGSSR